MHNGTKNSKRDNLVRLARTGSGSNPVADILRDIAGTHGTLFGENDVSAGSETELQAAVVGSSTDVDLPSAIEQSRFFANLAKRTASGEAPEHQMDSLRSFLDENTTNVWENSWVRFELRHLSPYARRVLNQDLQADKANPQSQPRRDQQRFRFTSMAGRECVRVPISYLIKLALADVTGTQEQHMPAALRRAAQSLQQFFLNDNTSPETISFNVTSPSRENGQGLALARESAQRYLLTQLLVEYANERFALRENGQEALVYCAPHPPQRQKQLNDLIPDAFYRELFMSPCLSGWDRGEEKHTYMKLCHQVLSRSQLNAVAKLREAGIITRNLVVLPNMSNISLANNGVHVSLGSKTLTSLLRNNSDTYTAGVEKQCADLSIKIQEHFLPLFVGSYSAAPHRIGFEHFHPEKALGFLPHELDFTHLRMLWRRWRKKADLKFCGRTLTPFGPEWLDSSLSRMCRLRGDMVPDFRLVDYPLGFLSTGESPALDGSRGNQERLCADLDSMGVFDARMSLYQFIKMRQFSSMGFSGFEGRYYSLFGSFKTDMAHAVTLQQLITALSFKYMSQDGFTHRHIPDNPQVESERRQIFFARALDLPTFYVRRNTRNRLLLKIMRRTRNMRNSRRYPGYIRIYVKDYCLALLELIQNDAQDLIEELGCAGMLEDLWHRIEIPEKHATSGRLSRDIASKCGHNRALDIPAREFNAAAEEHYRTDLRHAQIQEAVELLSPDIGALHSRIQPPELKQWLGRLTEGRELDQSFIHYGKKLTAGHLEGQQLLNMINLVLSSVYTDGKTQEEQTNTGGADAGSAPVYRAC
ncbi:MAG: hypothetical protein ACQEQK_08870 [Thermodesulfobacteriota bacterium]